MRINKLREQVELKTNGVAIIFSEINIRYLSGFSGHAATLLISGQSSYLITDYRYYEQAKQEAPTCTVICRDRANQTLAALISELLHKEQCAAVFFESQHINVAHWSAILKDIEQVPTVQSISPVVGMVEQQRMIKSNEEIGYIRQAAAIADQALSNIIPLIKTGITERELANELEYQMALLGSEELSFATILGFGERSALPHGVPSNRALQSGDIILIDFGAVVNGYHSDMTRTFIFGKASAQQKEVYDLVLKAQQTAIAALSNGVSGQFLQQQAEHVLHNSPYKEYTGEGLGHGLGMQLHEQPFLGLNCHTPIETGCVITIEPGIYIPNWGGIRIEDDVVLTERGLEILTQSPKALIEL